MLDIVQAELTRALAVERFDGKMSMKKRTRALRRCTSNLSQGMLISIKAGGTGLDLTSFQHKSFWNRAIIQVSRNKH